MGRVVEGQLTDKQQAFVREYLICFDATRAARVAKYKGNVQQIGYQLLHNTSVQQALVQKSAALVKKHGIQIDQVVSEIAAIAFANMKDYAQWSDGGVSLIDSESLTREQAAVVAEISERDTKYGRHVRFKLHDKVAALGKLEKYLELGQMGMLPWKDVLEALAEMARIVELYVSDEATIEKIKEGWSRIPIRPQRVVTE